MVKLGIIKKIFKSHLKLYKTMGSFVGYEGELETIKIWKHKQHPDSGYVSWKCVRGSPGSTPGHGGHLNIYYNSNNSEYTCWTNMLNNC